MEHNYFIPLVQTPPATSAVYWDSVSELSEEYPCSALLQVMRAKLALDLNKPEKNQLLKRASISVIDRSLLKQYVEDEVIQAHPPMHWHSWNAKAIEELPTDAEIKAEEEAEIEVLEAIAEENAVVENIETPIVEFKPEAHGILTVNPIPEPVIEQEPYYVPVGPELVNDLLANLKALEKTHHKYEEELALHPIASENLTIEAPVSVSINNSSIEVPVNEEVSPELILDSESETETSIPQTEKPEPVSLFWEAPQDFVPAYEASSVTEEIAEIKESTEVLSDDEKTFLHAELDVQEANAMFEFEEETITETSIITETVPSIALDPAPIVQPKAIEEDLIDKFIANNPKIAINKQAAFQNSDATTFHESETYVVPEITTENMANIYLKQGNKDKAVETYLKLILKFPEKTAYFTSQIQQAVSSAKK
jgi:tetratricopeptide (TPR) repeat protein